MFSWWILHANCKLPAKEAISMKSVLQSNFNVSNTDGSFTMAYLNSFLSPYGIFPVAQQNKYWGTFSILLWNCMLCVLIRITSLRQFEWVHTTYHYFVEDRKHFHKLLPFASWPGTMIKSHIGSNYPSLEQISMVPKMFEPLKFDRI